MPADDEHDPLDDWLNQQVRPLPPPPGTFALIKARARRRKLRKLAVSVVSAAAVAAAVAIAAPSVLALHLVPSATGSPAAAGRPGASGPAAATSGMPSPPGTPQGKASSYVAPVPSNAPSPEPSGPIPANFAPSSVTFVSPRTGWVIGQAGTPGQCANPVNPDICTSIARTDNAGQTWQGGPAPGTTGASGAAGVSAIRFFDGTSGWAFGPELWATHDEGAHWTRIDTRGQRVTDLETAGGRAYAVFATCPGPSPLGFASNCTSFTLMTTAAGSDAWMPAGGSTNGLTRGGRPASAMITLSGSIGYLLAPDGTIYSGPVGGSWQPAGTAPCQPGTAQASGGPGRAWLALVSPTRLAIACAGLTGTAPPGLSVSDNGGASWTQSTATAAGLAGSGPVTSLAAAPNGTLVLATTRGLYVLPAGGMRWQDTNATGARAPAGGFGYVGMTTDAQGVAVPADSGRHEIWMTFDGGLTWTPATTITPGN